MSSCFVNKFPCKILCFFREKCSLHRPLDAVAFLPASFTLVVSRCSFRFRSQPTDDVAKDLLHLFSHRERSQSLLPTELRSNIFPLSRLCFRFVQQWVCSLLNICKNEEVIPRTLRFCKKLCRHRPIFPGSHPPSIFGTDELNFCVRNGNRWDLIAIGTGYSTFSLRV